MSYQVIARKWRPQTFADVVGQQHVTRTIANAIRTGRVAHAYIFSGARGVGKTTTARILAKALNCTGGSTAEPCNECDSCREISVGTSLDVLEIDAASNRGIDQVRELREMVRYAPAGGRYKVVILDEAHMLTPEASNALLKTIEEPPEKVVFVLATTQPEDLAETIRSRSQHFHFRALSFAEIVAALTGIAAKEGLEVEEGALAVMARAADGSLRDAMSLLEQARAYCGTAIDESQVRAFLGVVATEVLDELVGAIESRSVERALTLVHRLLAEGQNLQQFCREAVAHFSQPANRACLRGGFRLGSGARRRERPRLGRSAAAFSEEDLTRFFQILLLTEDDLRRKPDPRLHLEMGLLRLVNTARLAPLEEILAELSGQASARTSRANVTGPEVISSAPTLAKALSAGPASPARMAAPAETAAAPLPLGDKKSTVTAAPGASAAVEASIATVSLSPVSEAKESASHGPVPGTMPSMIARTADPSSGLDAAQVAAIKSAILSQQKFLGELVDAATRAGSWRAVRYA